MASTLSVTPYLYGVLVLVFLRHLLMMFHVSLMNGVTPGEKALRPVGIVHIIRCCSGGLFNDAQGARQKG